MTGLDIGLDIDDCLFGWSDLAQTACDAHGISQGRLIDRWNFHETFEVSRDELWDVLFDAYRDGLLFDNAPYDGVTAILTALREEYGHRIHLITARGFEGQLAAMVQQDTAAWLEAFDVPFDSLHFAKDKTLLRVDCFLDDSPANCLAMSEVCDQVYLRRQPHNQSLRWPQPYGIVADLAHFAICIEPKIAGHPALTPTLSVA